MERNDLLPGAVLDPNAVNELFENVVYGDGLPVVDEGASQRRLEAERRRLEMERRAQQNSLRRAQAEKDRQFFDRLILSGPDRPPQRPHPESAPGHDPQSSRPARIQILFTAADRSRIPRKTRQQWLDKFSTAAESAFAGALATFDPAVILSLEQSVYQTAKTATGYIGAWMNRIHAMKSAPSLADFLTPSVKKDAVEEAPRPAEDATRAADVAPRSAENTTPTAEDTSAPDLPPLSAKAQTSRPGKASLLGKELPFSLFGSDNEDEMEQEEVDQDTAEDLQEVQEAVVTQANHCDQNMSDEPGPAVDLSENAVESTDNSPNESVPESASVAVQLVTSAQSCSESVKPCQAQSEEIQSIECITECDEKKQDEVAESAKPCTEEVVNRPISDSSECHQLKDKHAHKRTLQGSAESLLEKRRKTFDPECRTFIRDVVAAHLRLRFGRDLPGKIIVSIQTRVVDKILSNPKWTLERLRKHKRDIDDLAERYAEKIRREKPVAAPEK